MEVKGRHVVVTGGASGIGAALCRRFAAEGARAIVVADRDADGALAVASSIGAMAVTCDVSVEADVRYLVAHAEETSGPIDLFCANAGVAILGDVDVVDEQWDVAWRVNVLSHVFALRALLPGWLARGEGHFLATASAAGLLTNLGGVTYTVTKHAAVALAEWIAITHGDAGIHVACLCPQGVRTPMLAGTGREGELLLGADAIEPEAVADAVVAGLADGRFLILPHPEVADYERNRATDRDRWLGGMRRIQRRIRELAGGSS
jgi:NAD(P)-dependent dehydrogenase (short-subunit alcohol dehydrogenase family)